LSYFGAPDAKTRTFSVDTEGQLDEVLTKLNKDDTRGLRLIVVDMAAMDSPRMLRRLAELKGRVKDNGEIYDP
jgi:TPP-dependent 2-oxoacid decarboxylase